MSGKRDNFDWKRPDRVLGEQWSDWSGKLDEIESPASSRTFFFFATLVVLLGGMMLFFILYMVSPRLVSWSQGLPHRLTWVLGAVVVLAAIWLLMLAIAAWRGWPWMPGRKASLYFLRYLFDRGIGLARAVGVHRDRLGHSFVRFTNRLTRAHPPPGACKLLVLLPRCLKPEIRRELEAMGKEKGFDVYVATGGGSARQIIYEVKPRGIVAVACERDLVSGIKDVAPHLPVLAVANVRPSGPCKSTDVDMPLVRQYIDFFMVVDGRS